jgi:hypothetical protein
MNAQVRNTPRARALLAQAIAANGRVAAPEITALSGLVLTSFDVSSRTNIEPMC